MRNRKTFLLSSITLAVYALMDQAAAQQAQANDAPKMQRVEVTGSSIRRIDAEEALPVTVMKASDMEDRGYTTVADALDSLTVAQNVVPGGNSSGSVMNMRGVGVTRTLTIMDGQRMPYEPTQAAFVNMDLIPKNALDRVEVLRDGASSVYGSDAIGGVVNFITRRQFIGAQIKAQVVRPEHSGGANETGVSFIAGKGDLSEQGWTIYTAADIHRRTALPASARPDLGTIDQLNAMGIGPQQEAGDYATPANIIKPVTGNPYYAQGCKPPYSTPALSGTCAANNYPNYGLLLPGNGQASSFTRGSIQLSPTNTLTAQVSFTTEYINLSKGTALTSKGKAYNGGPTPVLTITPASPYYPGGSAGVPAMPGVTNQTLQLEWEANALGAATLRNRQNAGRVLVTDQGTWNDWDYKVNVDAGAVNESTTFRTGYVSGPGLYDGVLKGILNPFGDQTQAGMDYLKSISVLGWQSRYSTSRYDSINFTINHDLMQLAGGALAIAFGGDYHYESFRDMVPDSNVSVPFDGRSPSDSHASRRVKSVFAEVDIPITKKLDVDVSARADKYYDVGGTVNPKVDFRYQPLKTLMFRGSYNTGFHAPSLIESYGSTKGGIGNTKDKYDDPLLCPGGTPGVAGTGHALPGYSPLVVCNAKQPHMTGSNPNLAPEKSKAMTLGIVIDPIKNLSIAVDYWRIHVTDTIGTLSDALIFNDPQRYAPFYVRDADKNLLYVNAMSHNLGDTIASGEDITVNYVIPAGDKGKFTMSMDGTYNNRYDYQTEPGGEWYHNVGGFGGLSNGAITGDKIMTYRWRHNLRFSWMRGPWRATLTQMYNSSYHDGTAVDPQYYRDISSSTVYNLTGAYHGFKNVVINAGIHNLSDAAPPLTNTLSVGWLRTYASPVGRAYSLSATYNF